MINKDVKRLSQYVRDRQKALAKDRESKKPSPNERMLEGVAPYVASYDFWCEDCEQDFTAPAYLTKHKLYGDVIAVFRAFCECGEECIRHVTHRDNDRYYHLSEKINSQRNRYATDLLQAGQYGFKTHYGEPYKEYEKKIRNKEKRIIMSERETGLRGSSLKGQEKLKRMRR